MEAATVQLLVDFLYGAFHAKLSFEQAVQLFIASDKYCIHHARMDCVRARQAYLTDMPLILPYLTTLADHHNCLELQQVHCQIPSIIISE